MNLRTYRKNRHVLHFLLKNCGGSNHLISNACRSSLGKEAVDPGVLILLWKKWLQGRQTLHISFAYFIMFSSQNIYISSILCQYSFNQKTLTMTKHENIHIVSKQGSATSNGYHDYHYYIRKSILTWIYTPYSSLPRKRETRTLGKLLILWK